MPGPFDIDNWTTQLRKGLLEMCILNLLSTGEMYGYDLVKRMTDLRGLLISEGTVYPLLSRLRRAGLLETRIEESSSGPARRYYALAREGERVRNQMNGYWNSLVIEIETLQHAPTRRTGGTES